MQKYTDVVQNRLGLAVDGAKVLVTDINGSVATIFSNNGTTQQANPMTTNANGRFAFYAADGRYNLTVTINNVQYGEQRDIILNDPADPSPEKIDGGVIVNSQVNESEVNGCTITGGTAQQVTVTGSTISQSELDGITIDGLPPMTVGGQEYQNLVKEDQQLTAQSIEALRRSYAEAGYTLVAGNFEEGGTLTGANDVMITASGSGYSWAGTFPKVVADGTDPTVVGSGYVPRADVALRNELASTSGSELVSYYNLSLNMVIGKLFHASVLAAKLGVTLDATGGADSTAAIQAIVDYVKSIGGGNIYFEPGTYKHSGINCSELGSKRLKIIGAGKGVTKFNFTGSGTAFLHTENFEIDGCTITNISGSKATAIALGTPTARQAAYCRYTRIGVGGFKFAIWWRYSLWNTVRDFHTYDSLCGAKLSRNAFPHDQSNPSAPGSWNLDPGFFHNQNTWDNVVFEDGEIGFWGTVNGNSFHNVTAQKQISSTGSSNTVLPVGMAGVGAWFQNGSGTSTFGAQGNYIDSFYTEFTRQPLIIEYARVGIGSYYVQGGSSSDKYPQVFKLTGTTLDARGMSPSGSDWFNYGIVAVDSFIVGNPLGGIAISAGISAAASHQLTNTTWNDFATSKAVNKTWTPSGASTLALLTMSDRQSYTVVVGGVFDGSSMRSAQFEVYFHTSGYSRVMGHPSNSTDITCTVSGTALNLNVTGASFYDMRVTVITNRALGNFPVTG